MRHLGGLVGVKEEGDMLCGGLRLQGLPVFVEQLLMRKEVHIRNEFDGHLRPK